MHRQRHDSLLTRSRQLNSPCTDPDVPQPRLDHLPRLHQSKRPLFLQAHLLRRRPESRSQYHHHRLTRHHRLLGCDIWVSSRLSVRDTLFCAVGWYSARVLHQVVPNSAGASHFQFGARSDSLGAACVSSDTVANDAEQKSGHSGNISAGLLVSY